MIKARLLVFFGCLLLSACSGSLKQAIHDFSVHTPRPFGYVIGDEIEQRIDVTVRKGFTVQKDSLPALGQLNRWLTLKNFDIKSRHQHGETQYRIYLTYQIFYAPLEVKMLSLPEFELALQYKQGKQQVKESVPRWHFTVAPLRELAVRKENGHEYMRPDALPSLPDTGSMYDRLWAGLLLAALCASFLAYRHGLIARFPRQGIFKRALQALKRSRNQTPEHAFKIIHHALNELNRSVLFRHQLTELYQQHPAYRQLDAELQWFFDSSNRYHYAECVEENGPLLVRLQQLCRNCRRIEQGQR